MTNTDQSPLIDAMQAIASTDKGKLDFRGKLYTPVAVRVERLREAYGDRCAIYTEILHRDADEVLMKAEVWAMVGEDWCRLSTGYAEEARASKGVNSTSALENCETSAVGRALAALGLGGGEYASADELTNAVQEQSADEQKLERMNEALEQEYVAEAVKVIKDSLANNDLHTAAVAWFDELNDDDKIALWVAPSKGGIFTTQERTTIKSTEFRQARKSGDEEAA